MTCQKRKQTSDALSKKEVFIVIPWIDHARQDVGGASVRHRGYVIRHRGCVNCFRKLR